MPKYVDLAKGFARSLTADVMGGFGDTANNLENLARAGYGFIGSELGLLKPSQLPELREPKDAPLTSDWLAKNTPLEDTGSGEYTTGRLSSLVLPFLSGFASRARAPKPDELGAIVWHGSPHKFAPTPNNPLGEFDFSKAKLGTGEGAQAYGVGGYLAEAPTVAKSYIPATAYKDTVRKFLNDLPEDAETSDVMALLGKNKFTPEQERVIKELNNNDWLGFDYPAQAISAAYRPSLANNFDPSPELLDAVNNVGYLYKVDLPDEHIAKMLNWDKPLGQQSPEVQAALAKMPPVLNGYNQPMPPDASISDFYNALVARRNAGSHLDGTNRLREVGIPGISYLDGISRNAGSGTSNYVVFPGNENLLTILERNGVPLSSGFGKSPSLGPQSDALSTAQRNAALPLDQGGLGLPSNNLPMDRAQAMGFDINNPLYHATDAPADFTEFIPSPRGKLGAGVYTSPSAPYTEKYVGGENSRIVPLVARGKFSDEDARIQIQDKILQELKDKNPNFSIQEWKDKTLEELKRQGYSGSDVDKERVIFDPKNIRSRFAAFDPFKKDSANILAGFGGLGVLSTLLPQDGNAP